MGKGGDQLTVVYGDTEIVCGCLVVMDASDASILSVLWKGGDVVTVPCAFSSRLLQPCERAKV